MCFVMSKACWNGHTNRKSSYWVHAREQNLTNITQGVILVFEVSVRKVALYPLFFDAITVTWYEFLSTHYSTVKCSSVKLCAVSWIILYIHNLYVYLLYKRCSGWHRHQIITSFYHICWFTSNSIRVSFSWHFVHFTISNLKYTNAYRVFTL